MPALERSINLRGPKFFRDGNKLMFVLHLDSSTREGPRPATDADKEAHPEAYAAYREELAAPSPFMPLVSFKDPEGGPPHKEKGRHAQRRDEALERGEV